MNTLPVEHLLQLWNITPEWTLFLDRDGVMNVKPDNDYVRNAAQLQWLPGVPQSIALLNQFFRHTIVVTNQQGIGKGLMTEQDLKNLFAGMETDLGNVGAKIDAWYYCPHLATDNCLCRKPKVQMALQALTDFGDIDFKKAIMAGDSASDIEFGKRLGMKTVFIVPSLPMLPKNVPPSDIVCTGLPQFAAAFG
ncbi:HAD family hydrolase [Sphingobacteriales bacterium UPWRP_1]|nr:hypothetical protein B6N25_16550 [Sphingobacteriales bacterium TSM_CSS]PSJ73722.1 HAD family hydrolase [Sphingobacteriales bacterium UPWRP_1]